MPNFVNGLNVTVYVQHKQFAKFVSRIGHSSGQGDVNGYNGALEGRDWVLEGRDWVLEGRGSRGSHYKHPADHGADD